MNKSVFLRAGVILWGAPLIALFAYLGGIPYSVLISALALIGMEEYFRIMEALGRHPLRWMGFTGGLCVMIAWTLSGISVVWILLLTFILMSIAGTLAQNITYLDVTVTFTAIIYIPYLLGTLIFLRDGQLSGFEHPEDGKWIALGLWCALWFSDTLAYIIGKTIGRYHIAPDTSPKKTLEGSIAGIIGALLFMFFWWEIDLVDLDIAIAIGVAASIGGQIGDLFESKLKREAGIKDTSDFLPGHGGVLDRFDSTLVAAPLVALYLFVRANLFS